MNIVIVDDEKIILEGEIRTVRSCLPDASIAGFLTAEAALAFCENNPFDIALLDGELPGMNGIELAEKLKEINHTCNIVFITAYMDYAEKAIELHASGYILKPLTAEALKKEVADLR